jgi:hypothetical protein
MMHLNERGKHGAVDRRIEDAVHVHHSGSRESRELAEHPIHEMEPDEIFFGLEGDAVRKHGDHRLSQ